MFAWSFSLPQLSSLVIVFDLFCFCMYLLVFYADDLKNQTWWGLIWWKLLFIKNCIRYVKGFFVRLAWFTSLIAMECLLLCQGIGHRITMVYFAVEITETGSWSLGKSAGWKLIFSPLSKQCQFLSLHFWWLTLVWFYSSLLEIRFYPKYMANNNNKCLLVYVLVLWEID